MLSRAEVEQFVARVTYRPRWSFQVGADVEGMFLFITAPVSNAYRPDETIDLGIKSYLPPFRDTEGLRYWLEWRLGRVESHELREWFKIDGVAVSDPHA